MELKATTEPEQAQEAFSRIKYAERARLKADIQRFEDAGGQIEHVDGDRFSVDSARPGYMPNPIDSSKEPKKLKQQKSKVPFRRENLGKNKREILAAVEAGPGQTSNVIAENTGKGYRLVQTALYDLEGHLVESTWTVAPDVMGRLRNQKVWYPKG